MDLQIEIQNKLDELNASVKQLKYTGQNYASSYSNYRVALAKELVRLKDEGTPVTIAYDIARGNPEIAKKKFAEIRDEAIYKANLESINATKLHLKILENQLQREWSNERQD